MEERIFGDAGREMVIEEFLPGREMSIHVLTDGISHFVLPIAQDHKKLGEGDTGPNTGGMGAYAPAPFATPELQGQISREVVEPVLAALRKGRASISAAFSTSVLVWTGVSVLAFWNSNVRAVADP